VFPDTVDTVELPVRDDPAPFVEWLETETPDLVFTDAYPIDTEYQRAIREHVPLAVLQDDARHAVCADLFVNGNLYAAHLDYEFVGQEPETCLGPDYVLLRSEIRDRSASESPFRNPPKRAIVTMGGSDIAELTPAVIRAFDGFELRADAIVGPGFSDEQELEVRTAAENVSSEVRVVRDPDDLAERMFLADFAVSTASSTVYELLALGTPIVCQPIADNQELIAGALHEREAAIVLERGAGEDAFRRAIGEYVIDASLRRKRYKRGRDLVDGQGTERIVDHIYELSKT
jgi:spore coat polysaccharide biosynthesis predicted glycosyltransferase SpsG